MNIQESLVLAAAFDTRGRAESAIDELSHEGFRQDQIGVVVPGQGVTRAEETPTGRLEKAGAEGAAVGAATGGTLGGLIGGLVIALLPGIGQVLTGGFLAGIVLSAAAGAAAGSYLGPFVALGFSEQEVSFYDKELRGGRTIVVVKAGDRREQALNILRRHGGEQAPVPRASLASR
jgi:hypothetical protein